MKFPYTHFLPKLVAAAIGLPLFFLCHGIGFCGDDSERTQPAVSGKSVEQTPVKKQGGSPLAAYIPPKRGKPGGRIGGGTHGEGNEFPVISVLSPDHMGLTTKAQPDLYCYVSNPSNKPIEFTLNLEQEGKTVAHKGMRGAPKEGIWRISLSDLGLNLSANIRYTWFVTMVLDPDQPSTDVFSGGVIMRVNPSSALVKKLENAKESDFPAIYAMEGVWYEALSSLSRLIDKDPKNKGFYLQRASLLEQVELKREAALDRKAAGGMAPDP